jgi:hypothetical protein
MGMDVYGRNPKSERGEYFRSTIWGWRPIHEMIEQANVLPPDMVEEMSFNDGAGPEEDLALLLSYQLEQMIDGMDEEHEFMLSSEVDGPIGALISALNSQGIDIISPRGPVYSASVGHVRDFIEFCRESGGFQVC